MEVVSRHFTFLSTVLSKHGQYWPDANSCIVFPYLNATKTLEHSWRIETPDVQSASRANRGLGWL